MGRRSVLGNRSPNAGFLLVRSESGSSTKVSPKFHYAQARCFATALLRTRDFQGKPANTANSTPSDVTCLCTTTAPSPPQPGTDHDLKVAKPPLSMGQRSATQRNLQLSWKSGEEEIKFRRLMRLRKNVWIGETYARPPSVAATASLHYLQADDEPSNQTSSSLTQQIKTGLPKAAGNVKNIATEWLARQRQHRPSCTAKHFAFDIDLFKLIWPSAINSGLQHPQFRSQKLPHIWSHFWLRAIPFIFNSFANRKTFPASILNSQDGTSLAHPTNRIKNVWHDTWHKRFGRKRAGAFCNNSQAWLQTKWEAAYCDALDFFLSYQLHHTRKELREHQKQKISFHNWRGRRISLPKPCWIQMPFPTSIHKRKTQRASEWIQTTSWADSPPTPPISMMTSGISKTWSFWSCQTPLSTTLKLGGGAEKHRDK